jgi:hypothetical protein
MQNTGDNGTSEVGGLLYGGIIMMTTLENQL